MAKPAKIPENVKSDSSIVIYKYEIPADRITPAPGFEWVICEDGELRILNKEDKFKNPAGLWIVRTTTVSAPWGVGGMSCEKGGQKLKFGANGEIYFHVLHFDELVKCFSQTDKCTISTIDIRRYLKPKKYSNLTMDEKITQIFESNVSKNGLDGFSRSSCQSEIEPYLKALLPLNHLSLESFTIIGIKNYSDISRSCKDGERI